MSTFTRVVTGHAANGKSIVANDGKIDGVAVPGLPGAYLPTLWGADQPFTYPDTGAEPPHPAWFPGAVCSN